MTPTRRAAIALLLFAAACSGNRTRRHLDADDRGHPEGHVARVLAEHPCRSRTRPARRSASTIIWRGPLREDDRDAQISRSRASSAAASPASCSRRSTRRRSSQPVSATRRAAKIPGRDLRLGPEGQDYVSFVATDNHKGGRMAGEQLATLLERQGQRGGAALRRRVAAAPATARRVPRGDQGAPRHQDRQRQSVRRRRRRERLQEGEALLRSLKKPDGTLASTASSAPNESTTFGMLRVLAGQRLAGKVKFVGFDASESC